MYIFHLPSDKQFLNHDKRRKKGGLAKYTHPDGDGAGNNAINCGLRKGIEFAISPPHEVWLEQVPTASIELENSQVQLHS